MATAPNSAPACAAAPAQWMPGQYAECMHDAPWYSRGLTVSHSGPAAGEILKVRHVVMKRCPWNGKIVEMLAFDRWPQKAYPSSKFQHVTKPKFTIRSITGFAKRDPHVAGVGAAAIMTAVCYGAAAVAQIFVSDR